MKSWMLNILKDVPKIIKDLPIKIESQINNELHKIDSKLNLNDYLITALISGSPCAETLQYRRQTARSKLARQATKLL